MSVQTHDSQLIFPDLKIFACQNPVGIVQRDGKDRLPDDFTKLELGKNDRIFLLDHRKMRELRRILADYVEDRIFTGDERLIIIVRLDHNFRVRQFPHNFRQELCIQADDSPLQDRSLDNRLDSQFHIIGCQPDFVDRSINQDTVQDIHRCFGRNCPENDIDRFN